MPLFTIDRPIVSRKRKGGQTVTKRGLLFSLGTPAPPPKKRRRKSRKS